MSQYHIPVLKDVVIAELGIRAGRKYIDATIGGGGYGIEILGLGGVLLGIDTDTEALEYTREFFNAQSVGQEGIAWKLVKGNFRDIESIAKQNGFGLVDGVIFDLGVSSHQLDTPERGFSYRFTGAPLDLRLDATQGMTAAELLATRSEDELYEILAKYSEEQLARPIAHALVRRGRVKPIRTTGEMLSVIESLVPNPKARPPVLSRVFQGLRMAVNDEPNALKQGLAGASSVLVRSGRLGVISFHSLEDRVVKQFFAKGAWKLVNKKPLTATASEREQNPRSRSAKLRIAEKL